MTEDSSSWHMYDWNGVDWKESATVATAGLAHMNKHGSTVMVLEPSGGGGTGTVSIMKTFYWNGTVRTAASNSAKPCRTRHGPVVTNTHACDADTGGVTAAAGRGSPWLRAPSRSYRRTLTGARRSIFLETLLGAGMNGPSETLLGAEGLGVTLSSVLRENMRSAML